MIRQHILTAADIVGSKAELARRLGVTRQYINKMLRKNQCPPHRAVQIEDVTKGKVKAKSLRPDLFASRSARMAANKYSR